MNLSAFIRVVARAERATIRTILGLLACSSILVAPACGPGDDAPAITLEMPGSGSRIEGSIPQTKISAPYSFGSMMLCTSGTGSLTIERVELRDVVGEIRVTEFATRPNPNATGGYSIADSPEPLQELGFSTKEPVTVDTRCPKDVNSESAAESLVEFAVQLERVAKATSSYDSLTVVYSDGRAEGKLEIPFGVTLCAPEDKTAGCKAAS